MVHTEKPNAEIKLCSISWSDFKQWSRKHLFLLLEDCSETVFFEKLVLAISLAFSCFMHSKQDQSVLLWWWPALWRGPVPLSWTWKWSLLTLSSTSEEALSSGWGYSYHSTPSKPPVCDLETFPQKRQFLLCRTLSSKASSYSSSRPNHYFHRPGDLCLSEQGGLFMHSPEQDANIWRFHMILYVVMYFKDSSSHCKHF